MHAMNSFQAGEIVALGWTLLHFCWQTTAIALVYAIVDRCAARTASSVRYGLAITALALMALAAMATFIEQEHLVVPVERYQQQQAIASQLGALHTAIVQQIPIAEPVMGNGEIWIAEHAEQLMPWVDGLWLAGVLLLSLRAAAGWLQLQSVRNRAQALVPQRLTYSFNKLVMQFGMGRRVALRISNEVISPMVMGVWHITVLVPISAAMSLEPEQLEAILAHELAHVRRWDYLCNLLQTAVECLFFFHPAMWWVSKRARDFREVCCDEVAAQACKDPVIYAEALLQLEEQRAKHMRLAVALHGDGGTLLNRIRRVMGEKAMENKTISGVRIVAAGLVLTCLYAVPHVARGSKMTTEAAQIQQPVVAAPIVAAAPVAAVSRRAEATPATPLVAAIEPPTATPRPEPIAAPQPTPQPTPSPAAMEVQTQGGGLQFIDGMRSAGYTIDLDKDLNTLVSLRSVGVTPEYAKAMAQVGFGTPTLHDLVSLKSLGITPEYVASLKGSPIALASFHDAVTVKSLGITPEYAKSVGAMGLGSPTTHDVITFKSLGITQSYVDELKAGGLKPENMHDVVSMKSVGVTPDYAKSMAAAGFTSLSARDLISMKAQGMTPESMKWLKTTFPDADLHALRQASTFHIDPEFVASAKAHGFNTTSLDKLTKLKMSGLLN